MTTLPNSGGLARIHQNIILQNNRGWSRINVGSIQQWIDHVELNVTLIPRSWPTGRAIFHSRCLRSLVRSAIQGGVDIEASSEPYDSEEQGENQRQDERRFGDF